MQNVEQFLFNLDVNNGNNDDAIKVASMLEGFGMSNEQSNAATPIIMASANLFNRDATNIAYGVGEAFKKKGK